MLGELSVTKLIADYITPERVSLVVRVVLILLLGIPLVRLIRNIVRKLIKDRLSVQSETMLVRAVYYSSILILFITLLNEFGFKLSALLGAAGVFGIAIGFASQTSVSNIISGIFLISERPFKIDDLIQVGTTIGTVESIDLLSLKLRTADNRFVRVPNETMIKTEVINITRYPMRRVNLNITVGYNADVKRVMALLSDIAASEPLALTDPEPYIQLERFADSGIDILFGVWGKKDDVIIMKTSLMLSIKERFEQEHIEIPYPHVTIANPGEPNNATNNLNKDV